MTPFAQMIARDSMRASSKRLVDLCGHGIDIAEFACFDATAVWSEGADLGRRFVEANSIPSGTMFLPSPKTWVEVFLPAEERDGQHWHHGRWGWALEEVAGDPSRITVRFGQMEAGHERAVFALYPPRPFYRDRFPLGDLPSEKTDAEGGVPLDWNANRAIYGLLAIINSPNVVGRREHTPHKGLAREMRATRAIAPGVALRPWTEIVLDVTPPLAVEETNDGLRFTGAKARHFCRSHLRIQNGKLVVVSAHWRGDPALGIVQSRYRMKGPKL